MKNTKITYVLIVSVIIIWGVILYRFVTSISSDKQPKKDYSIHNNKGKEESLVQYSLKLNYRDPFLGNTYHKTILKIKPKKTITKIEPEINLDGITFNGVIGNSKNRIAIINLYGKEVLVKEGDVYNNITFIKHFSDSILIKIGTKKMILRK